MNAAVSRDRPRTPLSWAPGPRLLRAEVVKLTRRRGLMIAAFAVAAGPVAAYFTLGGVLHAASPARNGPPGGTAGYDHAVLLVQQLATVAAVMIGAAAGAGDVADGVFRGLVVTGRSRAALFLARVPAGLAVSLVTMSVAYLLGTGLSAALAGGTPSAPDWLVAGAGAWLLLRTAVSYLLALGLAALTRSRSLTVGLMLAASLILTPLAEMIQLLPAVRHLLPWFAVDQLEPVTLTQAPPLMSPLAVTVVVVGWTAVALAAGTWRTVTADA